MSQESIRPLAVTSIDPGHLGHLWRSLARLGLAPTADLGDAVWGHAQAYKQGWPLHCDVALPGTSLHLTIRPLTDGGDRLTTTTTIEVALRGGRQELETARRTMQSLLEYFEEEARMDCRGAEHFLGKPANFAWHTLDFPAIFLPTFHEAFRRELADWHLVQVGDPRGGKATSSVVRDASGRRVSTLTSARYFMRKEDAWLVADLLPMRGSTLVELSVEAVGTSAGWVDDLLKRLEGSLEGGAIAGSRRMTPSGEELELDRRYDWDDLFLDEGPKESLRKEVAGFFDRREQFARMGLSHRRGLLLHGPPGTGKTLVGKIVASTLPDCVFIWITAGHVTGPGEVASIFKIARYCRRVVLFFEDLDLYASQRETAATSAALGELLVQLDGMRSNNGILIIATTNDLESIEPALKNRPSRFDRLIPFVPASEPVRLAHLSKMLVPFGARPEALEVIARQTGGLTGAQLQELAFVARSRAAEAGASAIELDDLRAAAKAASEYKAEAVGFRPKRRSDVDELRDMMERGWES